MSKIIDVTLRFVNKFTGPMSKAVKSMEKSSKQIEKMKKEIQESSKKFSETGSSLTKSLTVPIVKAGVASFNLAVDLDKSINKVDTVFGKNSKGIKKWSKTTLDSYGIAQGTALDMAATYGDMSTGMGLSQNKAAKLSKSMVALAGDLSSYKDISVDQANTALEGVFTGETESLKKLGIAMSDTNLQSFALSKGMLKSTVSAGKMKELSNKVSSAQQTLAAKTKKYGANSLEAHKAQKSLNDALAKQSQTSKGSYKDMSEQEKVMLRYKYVTAMSKKSVGDFAKTSGETANQQKIFKEGLKQLGATMGDKLIPVGTKLIKWANSLIKKFTSMSSGQQNVIITILGLVAAVGPAISIIGKLTTGFKTMMLVVGNAKKAFAVFKSAGLLTAIGPGAVVVAVIVAIAIVAFLIIKNWSKLKSFFGKFGAFCKSIFSKVGAIIQNLGKMFVQAKLVVSKAISNIIVTIIKFVKPIYNFVKNIFTAISKVVSKFVSTVITRISDKISGLLKVFHGITTFISGVFTGNWSKAWKGVKSIFSGIFESFAGTAKTPINAVIGIINGAVDGINALGFKVPKWVPLLGGKKFSINIPKIPMLAKGTNNWHGGTAITQERGGEIMDIPRGTRVYPHDKSVRMARQEGAKTKGTVTVIIKKLADKIVVRSDKDIDDIVNKVADKFERIWNNTGEVPA